MDEATMSDDEQQTPTVEEWISAREFGRRTNLSKDTVLDMIAKGQISKVWRPREKIVRIHVSELPRPDKVQA